MKRKMMVPAKTTPTKGASKEQSKTRKMEQMGSGKKGRK